MIDKNSHFHDHPPIFILYFCSLVPHAQVSKPGGLEPGVRYSCSYERYSATAFPRQTAKDIPLGDNQVTRNVQ
jgi:hypothetical protein